MTRKVTKLAPHIVKPFIKYCQKYFFETLVLPPHLINTPYHPNLPPRPTNTSYHHIWKNDVYDHEHFVTFYWYRGCQITVAPPCSEDICLLLFREHPIFICRGKTFQGEGVKNFLEQFRGVKLFMRQSLLFFLFQLNHLFLVNVIYRGGNQENMGNSSTKCVIHIKRNTQYDSLWLLCHRCFCSGEFPHKIAHKFDRPS